MHRIGLLLALCLWPLAAGAETLAELNQSANQAYVAGDVAKAAAIAEDALVMARDTEDAPPDDAIGAINNVAYLLATTGGDTDRAEALWQEALDYAQAHGAEGGAGNLNTLFQLSGHLARTGRAEEGRAFIEQAMQLARGGPLQAQVAAALFRYQLDTGAYAAAAVALNEAIAINPETFRANFGDLYVELSKLIDAAQGKGDWNKVAPLAEAKIAI